MTERKPRKQGVLGLCTALLVVGGIVGSPAPIDAQDELCEEWYHSGDRERHCETRDYTVAAEGRLDIDGGMNGGVEVRGTNRNDVFVTVEIWATADSEARAQEIADDVSISTPRRRATRERPVTATRR